MKPFLAVFSLLSVFFLANLFVPKAVGFLVPALLLFVPLFLLPPPKAASGFFQGMLESLCLDTSWKQFFKSIAAFAISVLIVFPPYLVCAHFWMLNVFHYHGFHPAPPLIFAEPLLYQMLMVALPEEFFFRGYLQTALNNRFKPRWRFLGIAFGWGLILTSLIFAFAHSVIELQWWHFSIFFPSLLFGYLKERCGSITAPVLFHAFSNSIMVWFQASYF